MTNTHDVILQLKQIREERKLSFDTILKMMEQNGDYVSKSTLSRLFKDGSEDGYFKYDETIRPVAKALIDMETIEETDTMDTKAMKTILRYKMERIEELEAQLREEKLASYEKLEKQQAQYQKSIDFLREQINLKDKRMDFLLDANSKKDELNQRMMDRLLECPNFRKGDS